MGSFVLKNKNYLLLYVGSLVSNMGTTIYNFAISFYIYKITEDNATIAGLYLATGGLVFFLLALFGGAIVDRLDKVKVVYVTDFIRGTTIIVAGLLIFSGLSNSIILVVLFSTTIILGINGALFNPAIRSLPPHILEENQLQQSSSLLQGTAAIYQIFGAIIGGIMYNFVDIEWIFILNGLSFIFSGVSEMFITVTTKTVDVVIITLKQTLVDIKEGFKYLVKLKPIFRLVMVASILNFFTVPVIANGLPYLFAVELKENPVYLSYLTGAYMMGVIIIAFILGVRAQRERVSPLIRTGYVGMSVLFAAFIYLVYLIVVGKTTMVIFMVLGILSLLIMGIFNGLLNIPFSVAVMKTVDKSMLGRVMSVVSTIANGLTPIAMGLAGVVIDNFGLMILFYAAVIAIVLTMLMTVSDKEIGKL